MISKRWVRWGIYFAFWTLMGLLNAGSAVIELKRGQPDIALWKPILWEMSSLYTTGLICPFLIQFTRRFPLTASQWPQRLLLHLPAMGIFWLLHSSGMVAMRKAVYWMAGESYRFASDQLSTQLLYEFYKDIRLYWIIVFLALGFEYYNKFRQRELESSQLQTRLVEAQLENLKGQLNPHFLFNTLNMISAYMHEDVQTADRMMTRLSDLLRLTLHNSGRAEVTLREELDFLNLYLEIMKARFQEKLRIQIKVDPETRQALVPNLILQPLVENAVRHGISRRVQGGSIELEISLSNGRLQLVVRDDGPGIDAPAQTLFSRGHGLSNTAERLQRLYGQEHRFDLKDAPGGGLEIQIIIPFRSPDGVVS